MPIDWIRELLALSVILLAGASVFYAVVRSPERYARLERVAYCYPLGMAALGIPMFLLSWAGYHLNVATIAGISLGGLMVARLARGVPLANFWLARGEPDTRQRFTEFEWVLLAIIIVCLASRLVTSMLAPLNDNDGIAEWGFKAKILYYDTLKTTDYYYRAEFGFSNQTYPLLWPFMYAWMCTVLGKWDDLGMLILNPVNVIVFGILLYYTGRRYVVRPVALGITAIMVSLPALLHYAECGQADVPLMLMAGATFFCLFDWMQTRRLDAVLLASILMAGVLFLKVQGAVVFCAYGAVAALSAWSGNRRKNFQQLVIFVVVALGLMLPWYIFARRITNWNSGSDHVSIATIRWADLGPALLYVAEDGLRFYNSIHLPKWNILFPTLVLAMAISKSAWQKPWCFILPACILQSAAIILIYIAAPEPLSLGSGREFGWERDMLVILAPLWLLLAKCADEQWRIWNNTENESRKEDREKRSKTAISRI